VASVELSFRAMIHLCRGRREDLDGVAHHGHAGVINTVREAVEPTGVRRVHALVGGFYLCGASSRRIEATIRDLRAFSPRWVIPSHCSGLEFEAALMRAFPRGCAIDSVGTRYSETAPA
jgi:7,8-dihydropterin-6-yl-methyl-4-(beta-D-ribofuranosyl)aminobenzene 5'-phosphate synthase